MRDFKLSYDDVTVVPEIVTTIKSRSECDIWSNTYCGITESTFARQPMLPIFTAPMDTVIDENNFNEFLKLGIIPVLPRTIDLIGRCRLAYKNNIFAAFSIEEARMVYIDHKKGDYLRELIGKYNDIHLDCIPNKMCIDLANGHMQQVPDLIKEIKTKYGDKVTVMAGNVANPKTYKLYEEAGCDYLRLGIGGGKSCLTASNTGVYYPYFSLLEETYRIKQEIGGKCAIVADGNIRGFRDIQKALVFADYVMIGSLFNKAIESAAPTTYGSFYWNFKGKRILRPLTTLFLRGKKVNQYDEKIKKGWKKGKYTLFKEFRGMSTKESQKKMGNEKLKTSEGIIIYQKVEYKLAGWVENECDNLKSAFSYTNTRNLDEYKDSEYCLNLTMRHND
jgi:IMP dehydrogenase/GMP reductase